MTQQEMRQLRTGDRLRFSDGVEGTVTAHNRWCVTVDWDDGQAGSIAVEDGDQIEPG